MKSELENKIEVLIQVLDEIKEKSKLFNSDFFNFTNLESNIINEFIGIV